MGAMTCPRCGEPNDADARYCEECGASLSASCPACGTPISPGKRFCKSCGAPVGDGQAAATAAATPSVELRVVSVLFVDLVGYTTLAESRDAEDVRDLLSRYFETARTIVGRYGGVVEKFIGDAVMTVWGAPTTREDDAERAVRAGLEIVDAVAAFGEEVGAPHLRARAGVVTGQVASAAGTDDALVVGDRVNTAARVQSIAQPGTVYVDDVTRRASSAAIAYEDAGEHVLKGKADPVRLWRATRVVAGVAGAQREEGLEAPFVGRESELRLLKDLFHATVERGAARLVAITGAPGTGKSRLRRELENYVDGLLDVVLWHSGRCLSYGDGVAYWALAEMVRQRMAIAEESAAQEAERKLALGLERWIADPRERDYLAPRLGLLLGTAEPALDQRELFAGWRLFFERLAETSPVVMAFEDLHAADEGLLDFIEHVLTWSSEHPILILGCARPELADRRPDWGAGRASVTPMFLEPLPERAIDELLDGLVVDFPEDIRAGIVERAEGIPLYALETIRALADRGALAPTDDGRLAIAGDVGEIAIPTTLTSLLSARLDALPSVERALVKALAVWGGWFGRTAAVALSPVDEGDIDDSLDALVRKHVLVVRADPLSPDRGQYAFAQSMLRSVAYGHLSRRERKALHLAAARHLRSAYPSDGEEVAEVVAAHQLDAYRAAANDPDADDLRRAAIDALRGAGRRAEAIGAPEAAERAYRTALQLADDEEERLALMEAAADVASLAGRYEPAIELLQTVADARARAGRARDAARLAGRIGRAMRYQGRGSEAIERLREALAVLGADALDPDVAEVNLQLGTALAFAGRVDEAMVALERSLIAAEALELPAVLCGALTSTAVAYAFMQRHEQERALLQIAAELAERHGVSREATRARSNLGESLLLRDLPESTPALDAALESARRLGDRGFECIAAGNLMYRYLLTGAWDEIDRLAATLLGDGSADRSESVYVHDRLVQLELARGDPAAATRHLEALAPWRETEDVEDQALHEAAQACVAMAGDDVAGGLELALAMLARVADVLGVGHEAVRHAWPAAVEAALALGRLDALDTLIGHVEGRPPGHVPPFMRAALALARGRLAVARADDAGEEHLRGAVEAFARLSYPFWLARAQTELAGLLLERGRQPEAGALLDEAIERLTPLRATPALARARELTAAHVIPAARSG